VFPIVLSVVGMLGMKTFRNHRQTSGGARAKQCVASHACMVFTDVSVLGRIIHTASVHGVGQSTALRLPGHPVPYSAT
jgi:hypothetical protein